MALVNTSEISRFSSSLVKSSFDICMAYDSHSRLLRTFRHHRPTVTA